jgi:hypothetical protein
MGFDIGYSDTLRDTLRGVIAQASGGRDARLDLDQLRGALYLTYNDTACWTVFNASKITT